METAGPPKRRRRKPRSRAANLFWAAVFLVLGIIGVLIPIVPQVPFFILSLFFLSLVSRRVRRAARRFLSRNPRMHAAYRRWRDRARRKRRELIAREKAFAARMRRDA